MGEEGTLRQLKAHRKELIDPKITEHRGRIVKTTGDGIRCPLLALSGHRAFGGKADIGCALQMSAFGTKADMRRTDQSIT